MVEYNNQIKYVILYNVYIINIFFRYIVVLNTMLRYIHKVLSINPQNMQLLTKEVLCIKECQSKVNVQFNCTLKY